MTKEGLGRRQYTASNVAPLLVLLCVNVQHCAASVVWLPLTIVLVFVVTMRPMIKLVRMTALDDAPWNWKGAWNSDMPQFFAQVKGKSSSSDHS